MKENYDIAIIGGGASGLTAAITAARLAPELSVVVLEKKETTGKKLSAAGNGRCNLSNTECEHLEIVMDFFRSVGISVRRDPEGRIYPYAEDAGDVAELLTGCARGAGVEIILNSQVTGMEAEPSGGFLLLVEGKAVSAGIHAGKVLIATGGKSYASMGTTGDGYVIARKLGHSVSRLVPALTAVEVREDLTDLKGVRVKAEASLYKDGEVIFRERGEVQFRADSLSGICIMNMSRNIKRGDEFQIGLNLVPDFGADELRALIKERFSIKGLTAAEALKTLVRMPLAERALINSGIDPESTAEYSDGNDGKVDGKVDGKIDGKDDGKIQTLIEALRDVRFKVKDLKGWNEAQVTSGGVDPAEVERTTMESKLIPGLFFSGEVLDYDGPCGGYNLHHAWLTGICAGKGMAGKVMAGKGMAGKVMTGRCTESTR